MLPAVQEQAAYDNKDYEYCIRTLCEHEEVRYVAFYLFRFIQTEQAKLVLNP